VRDEGPGVLPAERERIFEPLYQVSGSEDLGVAGLGLTLARDVVRSHGGEIGCAGDAGTGATFWFTLPSASGDL
jgi:signal transduction histidine kinase